MKQIYILQKARDEKHKFQIETPSGKKVKFGAVGYQDFRIHQDDTRKQAYIRRHQANEDWNNLEKAGTWSRYLLWNKVTLDTSIKDMEKLFGIKIENRA